MKSISILGSTGSIGTQALDIIRKNLDEFNVCALSANKNITLLNQQIKEFSPEIVAVMDKEKADELKKIVDIPVYSGLDGLNKVATLDSSEILLTSVVGSTGLIPTIKAIEAKKTIALANKETLVTAGKIVMEKATINEVPILPVDSEHSALFQAMQCGKKSEIKRLILTCSGGPFRNFTKDQLDKVTLSDALSHPTWNMGNKITIDSATLMNKGFEVIEAHHLYDFPYENIDVIVHPQSIIHSLVEFIDHSTIAQLSFPDMGIPIQYAFSYPNRIKNNFKPLDLSRIKGMDFFNPDKELFPCLDYAYDAGIIGGTMPTVLNAANEAAVKLFLDTKIQYSEIAKIIKSELDNHNLIRNPDIDDIINIDKKIKKKVEEKKRMNIAIITAAGIGKRMNATKNKLLLQLEGKPIIYYTIKVFENSKSIDKIILVSNKGDIGELNHLVEKYNLKKVDKIIEGGSERQYSVYNGIRSIPSPSDDDILLIHNGANLFVDDKIIRDSIKATNEYGASVAAVPSRDTIKIVEDGFVKETLDRSKLWHMHTPQCIKYSIAIKAFEKAEHDNFLGTDDVTLVERLGRKVKIVDSTDDNIKITFPKDLEKARFIQAGTRIGYGIDSHKFDTNSKQLWLAGILIPDEQGMLANSDGDVILHSLFNAFSSAIGERSISCYADDMCKKGIKDSKEYILVIKEILDKRNYAINNIAIALEGKKPKLEKYVPEMKKSISQLLDIDVDSIGITLTTGEDLTDFGKGFGLKVESVCTIIKK